MSHTHDHDHDHEHEAPKASAERPLYWSTLEQYHQTPEYIARRDEEFYPEAKPEKYFDALDRGEENPGVVDSPMQRRTFLKLSGFAAVLAAVAACERPVTKILPYVTSPEDLIPGVQNYYATTCGECAAACGIVSTNRDGRPIKLEGNKAHAVNKGSLCARAQSSLLNLYNPDRAQSPMEIDRATGKGVPIEMAKADAAIASKLKTAPGKVVLLTGTMHGPTRARLMADMKKVFPTFEHVMYDPISTGIDTEAYRKAFGITGGPRYMFQNAETVVLLGGDPISQGVSRVEYQRGLAERRKPDDHMSRIYSFEPVPTLSGAYADYRFRVRTDTLLFVALAIAGELGFGAGLPSVTASEAETAADVPSGTIAKIATRLRRDAGKSLVYCESSTLSGREGRALAAVCAWINESLGNIGKTIDITGSPSNQSGGSHAAMMRLMDDLKEGRVGALLFHGVNPAYTLPNREEFATAMKGVPYVVSLNLKHDETTKLANIHMPASHWLETWGDAEPQQGLFSIIQPMIELPWQVRPLETALIAFATASGSDQFIREIPHAIDATDEVKATPMAKRAATMYEYTRETWRGMHKEYAVVGAFEDFWDSVLRLGVFDRADEVRRAALPAKPAYRSDAKREIDAPSTGNDTNVVLHPSIAHGDGESMGNPFLLELPDSLTKVAWDNYAGLSPEMAASLDVSEGDWVTVSAEGGASIEAPVWVWPGVEKSTVALMLGWGRTAVGDIGNGVGVDVYPLARIEADTVAFAGRKVSVAKITDGLDERNSMRKPRLGMTNPSISQMLEGPKYRFANTQGHNYLGGRPIFFETTLHQLNTPEFEGHLYNHWYNGKDKNEFINAWGKEHKYAGHHWGMVIDYNACSACGACLVACQAENNIPVVGKIDIIKGREMHWIRIDRYYRGNEADPDHAFQMMLCQHCGTAPCETVCPVAATLHNDEGLNTMIYNRCVGTRYCLNNCPYKVRRFNWHQYSEFRTGFHENQKAISPLELALNPDVTVRTRGVMEKCTFCVHRIKRAKEKSRTRGTALLDGEMETACQTSCPGKAITFGDRNDPESKLMSLWNDRRAHGVLSDLNTQPGIRYLALVRNRDEDVPKDYLGLHRGEHHGGEHDAGADHGQDDHNPSHNSNDHSQKPQTSGAAVAGQG